MTVKEGKGNGDREVLTSRLGQWCRMDETRVRSGSLEAPNVVLPPWRPTVLRSCSYGGDVHIKPGAGE